MLTIRWSAASLPLLVPGFVVRLKPFHSGPIYAALKPHCRCRPSHPPCISLSPLFPSLLHLYVQDDLPTLMAQDLLRHTLYRAHIVTHLSVQWTETHVILTYCISIKSKRKRVSGGSVTIKKHISTSIDCPLVFVPPEHVLMPDLTHSFIVNMQPSLPIATVSARMKQIHRIVPNIGSHTMVVKHAIECVA